MKIIRRLVLFLIVIALIYLIFFNIKDFVLKKIYPKEFQLYVEQYAKEYNLNPNIIYAIIKNESNFDKNISSNKGAIGLMQIMQETGDEVSKRINMEEINLLDAKTNIQIGTKYFSELYQKYNNANLALAAYNAGTGNVDKWIKSGIINVSGDNIENIPYKETNMYVRKVIQTEKIYEVLYK